MKLGEKIKAARKAKGWSQATLGEKVNISQVAIKKIESNDTKDSRHLVKIYRVLDLPMTDLHYGIVDSTDKTSTKPVKDLVGDRNLPVYASVEGGGGAIILSTDPVDYVRRPAPLAEVKDGYGLIISLDSMIPEFKPGDTALVHPHLPPIRGEACVFYADDGKGTVRATIKSFVSKTATQWHVEQWNPPKKFTLSRAEWQQCHRVVGKYGRR